jgi:hypothetical protein
LGVDWAKRPEKMDFFTAVEDMDNPKHLIRSWVVSSASAVLVILLLQYNFVPLKLNFLKLS